MKPSLDILDELKSTSPLLAGMDRINVFSVPTGYFEALSGEIFMRCDTTSAIKGLNVPEGYFDGLANQIITRIRKEDASAELRKLSPLLYSIQGENVFTVPRDYFNGLAENINDRLKPAAKVVKMPLGKRIVQFAAAAMISSILATSGWWISNREQGNNAEQNTAFGDVLKDSKQYKTVAQIEEGIDKISEDEIIKYLESTGTDADNELLAKNITEQELPAQTDYLLDEKTLETYLNQIDSKTNN